MDLLKVENLSAGYGNELIIEDINLKIRKTEFTALLGLNGSGKTTLLKTISGLIKPREGKSLLNEEDIHLMKDKNRAQKISYMAQSHNMPYDTPVKDVVLMGITPYLHTFESPSRDYENLAHQMLQLMNMEEAINENFNNLSEGQKQLVVIARNLMQRASLMLFDEPDSALDFTNKHMVLGKIRKIVKTSNRGGLITLHDPNYALEYCDRIILMNKGRISAHFSTDNLSIGLLNQVFSSVYENIEIIKHRGKYFVMRSDYESRI